MNHRFFKTLTLFVSLLSLFCSQICKGDTYDELTNHLLETWLTTSLLIKDLRNENLSLDHVIQHYKDNLRDDDENYFSKNSNIITLLNCLFLNKQSPLNNCLTRTKFADLLDNLLKGKMYVEDFTLQLQYYTKRLKS